MLKQLLGFAFQLGPQGLKHEVLLVANYLVLNEVVFEVGQVAVEEPASAEDHGYRQQVPEFAGKRVFRLLFLLALL